MAAIGSDPPILDYAAPGVGGPSTLQPDLEQILQAGPTARQFSAYFEKAGLAKQYLVQSLEHRFGAPQVTGICAACGTATASIADVKLSFSIPPVNQHGLVMPRETDGEVMTCHSMCELCLEKSYRWTQLSRLSVPVQSLLSWCLTAGIWMMLLNLKFEWTRSLWIFLLLFAGLILQTTLPYVERYCRRRSVPDEVVRSIPAWVGCREVAPRATAKLIDRSEHHG